CIHPRGITGIEIVKGEIMLVDWRIRPNDEGELRISKKIIRGPEPIINYQFD
ncbi:MAG: serine/threonine protein phosphatase, partial [Vallitaleaceae bacterium]|nr:serine/threonine protein phosphatase [Vallitaleaceae bacterium]